MKTRFQASAAWLFAALLIIGFPLLGKAITITGADTVCKGTQHPYSISPTAGVIYQWQVTPEGTVSPVTGAGTIVYWGAAGNATITVNGYDVNNNLVETDDRNVFVVPPPEPVIGWDVQVGCQIADSVFEHSSDLNVQDGNCLRVCENSTVIYTVINAQPGSSFGWQVTGATTVTPSGSSCTVVWGAAGQGAVSVTDTNKWGCYGTTFMCIEIMPGPKALFTMKPYLWTDDFYTCVNKINLFEDLSTQGAGTPIVSWYWNFGDGTPPSPLQNPTHIYTSPGVYTVSLTVTNECNCKRSYRKRVTVLESEGLTIRCPSVVCENQIARYWLEPWDGTVAACIDAGLAYWQVDGGSIIQNNGEWIDVLWDSMSLNTTGFGYVSFYISADCGYPCPTPTIVKVPVVQQIGYIQGPDPICAGGKQYRYKLPQWPATVFNWTMSTTTGAILIPTDQPNEYIIQTNQPGEIDIKVVYENTLLGCTGFAKKHIKVLLPPTISGPLTVCQSSTVTYSLSGSYVGNWSLTRPGAVQTGTGNTFNANFPVAGNYILTVSGFGFCSPDPLNIQALAKPPIPDSLLGPDTVCAGTPYIFTAKNAIPGTIFHWAVTGGTFSGSSSGNNVSISFSPGGPHTIKVWREIVQSPYCASDTLTKLVYPPNVTVDITGADTACANTYHDYSAGYGSGETYEWEIYTPNLGSVSTQNPGADVTILWNHVTTAQYAALIVKVRKCGVDYRDTLMVWVTPSITVNIVAPDTVCRDELFVASFTSSPTMTSYNTITWDFGDGTGSSALSPSHAYTALNGGNVTYTISLEVTEPNGCYASSTDVHDIVVMPAPVANVTPTGTFYLCDTMNGLPINLVATVQSGFGTTTGIDWYWNTNQMSSGGAGNVNYTANYMGQHWAIVTNDNGCSAQTNIVSIIYSCNTPCTIVPYPTVHIDGVLKDCGYVELYGSYTSGGFNPSWTYPPQATPTVLDPNLAGFNFTAAGNYTFIYSVGYLDILGDTCWVNDTVNIIIPFIAGLKYNITCGSTPGTYQVQLIDHSNYYPPNVMTQWDFYITNMTTPVQSGSSTIYTTNLTPGTYNVALRIENGNPLDLECWAYETIVIPDYPHADFSYAPDTIPAICVGYPVSFTSLATPAGLDHLWDFYDGAYNLQVNPERVYSTLSPNPKLVTLTVTDIYRCSDDTVIAVQIHENDLEGEIDPIGPACEGTPVNLNYTNFNILGNPTNYEWILNNDAIFNTSYTPVNIYEPGDWWVTVTDQYYCSYTTEAVQVEYTQVPDAVITGDTNYCHNTAFTLYGYAGPDITLYEWFRNGSLVASGNVPALLQTGLAVGTYNYRLVISVAKPGGGFCTDTSDVFTVHVNNPPPDPTIGFSMLDCDLYMVELWASNSVAGTYTWSNGMSGQNVYVYTGGPYKVYFNDGSGCITTAEMDVPKDPLLYLWVFPEGCYKLCAELLEQGHYVLNGPIIPFYFWEWANDFYTENGSGYVNPYQVIAPGQHTLTLDNGYCSRTSGIMDVEPVECGCDLSYDIENIWVDWTHDSCYVYMQISIHNPYPNSATVTLSSPDGDWLPSVITVPPGGGIYTVRFLPNSGFTGGSTMLYIYGQIVTDEGIFPCYWAQEIGFPDICDYWRPSPEAAGGNQSVIKGDGNSLTLAPNPAANSTKVLYRYAGASDAARSIELFELTGRHLGSYPVPQREGSFELDLGGHAAGMYLVVMQEGGKALLHQKLTITK